MSASMGARKIKRSVANNDMALNSARSVYYYLALCRHQYEHIGRSVDIEEFFSESDIRMCCDSGCDLALQVLFEIDN